MGLPQLSRMASSTISSVPRHRHPSARWSRCPEIRFACYRYGGFLLGEKALRAPYSDALPEEASILIAFHKREELIELLHLGLRFKAGPLEVPIHPEDSGRGYLVFVRLRHLYQGARRMGARGRSPGCRGQEAAISRRSVPSGERGGDQNSASPCSGSNGSVSGQAAAGRCRSSS